MALVINARQTLGVRLRLCTGIHRRVHTNNNACMLYGTRSLALVTVTVPVLEVRARLRLFALCSVGSGAKRANLRQAAKLPNNTDPAWVAPCT